MYPRLYKTSLKIKKPRKLLSVFPHAVGNEAKLMFIKVKNMNTLVYFFHASIYIFSTTTPTGMAFSSFRKLLGLE